MPGTAQTDPDLAKKAGINAFKQSSHQVQVTEMNLDEEQIRQMRAKKEEMLKNMGEDQEAESEQKTPDTTKSVEEKPQIEEKKSRKKRDSEDRDDDEIVGKKRKKKNKKGKKRKGIDDFLDGDGEAEALRQDEQGDTTAQNTSKPTDPPVAEKGEEELLGSSLVQELDDGIEVEKKPAREPIDFTKGKL